MRKDLVVLVKKRIYEGLLFLVEDYFFFLCVCDSVYVMVFDFCESCLVINVFLLDVFLDL